VVDAVRCAIEVQNGLAERNAGVARARRIEFRIGIHLGDVVEEVEGDLMGGGVNIAARIERVAKPGGIYLSEDAYRPVKGRLDFPVADLGPTRLKNIAEPIRIYSLELGRPTKPKSASAPAPDADLRHLSCPRPLDGEERRSDVSCPARTHSRRPAQSRSPRTMIARRPLAAILALDVVGYSC
jgi:adenylate cyclase